MQVRPHTLDALWKPGLPRSVSILFFILWCAIAVVILFIDPFFIFLQFFATCIIALFCYRPDFPLYLIAALYPFIEWQIVRGNFNAPIVDIIAVFAIAAWGVRFLWHFLVFRRIPEKTQLWGFLLFLLWALVAALSSYFSADQAISVKYTVRFLLFFVIAYVWFPINHIRSMKQIITLLLIFYAVGVAIALYGLAGFFLSDAPSFLARRAVPIDIFGFYPLGSNHNVIADNMITAIPIGLFFLYFYRKMPQQQKIVAIGVFFLVLTNILTFSRTGWLALFLEIAVLIFLLYRDRLKEIFRLGAFLSILFSPLLVYMIFFSSQDIVDSSNYNRIILNEITWQNFSEKPFFGQGPGTFISTVAYNNVYIEEFGAPLDAHGFIQKISSEMGVFGLVTFFLILFFVLRSLYRGYQFFVHRDFESYLIAALIVLVAGGIFFQLFQTSYFVSKMWFPIGLSLGILTFLKKNSSDEKKKRNLSKSGS